MTPTSGNPRRIFLFGLIAWLIVVLIAILTHGDLKEKKATTPPTGTTSTSTSTSPTPTTTTGGGKAERVSASVTGKKVVLTGLVPTSAVRARIGAGAAARYGLANVVNRIMVDRTVTVQDWTTSLAALVGSLDENLTNPTIEAVGATVTISGSVPDDATRAAVLTSARSTLGPGVRVIDSLTVEAPASSTAAAVQKSLDSVLASATIEFETGSSRLSTEGVRTLDRIVPILRKASALAIQIDGYTDSSGAASANVTLSQQRADAVKAYLSSKGIAAARLSTHGYGPANPVASNETASGRAKNRLIELTVKGA